MKPVYKRVILKLSGESLSGDLSYGLDHDTLISLTSQVKELVDAGVSVGIVCGGGNIWRGVTGSKNNSMDRAYADYMGMLATCINGLALQAAFTEIGVESRVMSAVEMPKVIEDYTIAKARKHLDEGKVVIFTGGTGSPFFSTDSGAALRACEVKAEVILMAKKVDGVYDEDPKLVPTATKFDKITFSEALSRNLKVMDSTAFSMCMDNNIDIFVFNVFEKGNIYKAACGENIGTIVRREFTC